MIEEISNKIIMAMSQIHKKGIEPVVVYLGRDECKWAESIVNKLQTRCINRVKLKKGATIFGLELVKVKRKSYLKVY